MSGPLKHVNGLILDDGPELLAIDTGTASPRSTEAWRTILEGPLAGQRIGKIMCTHMHPDHVGLAGWLSRRFDDADIAQAANLTTVRQNPLEMGRNAARKTLSLLRGQTPDASYESQEATLMLRDTTRRVATDRS